MSDGPDWFMIAHTTDAMVNTTERHIINEYWKDGRENVYYGFRDITFLEPARLILFEKRGERSSDRGRRRPHGVWRISN
jgi:hypothetical protein